MVRWLICCCGLNGNIRFNNSAAKSFDRTTSSRRYIGATICTFLIVSVWLSMAELVKGIQYVYPKAFLLTVIARGMYIIFFPLWGLYYILKYFCGVSSREVKEGYTPFCADWKHLAYTSVPLSLIGLASTIFWYLSLPSTSVSGNTAIYQSSCAAVFIISVIFLKESITAVKVLAVSLSIIGVFCISFSNTDTAPTLKVTSTPKSVEKLLFSKGEEVVPAVVPSSFLSEDTVVSHPCITGYLLCFLSTVSFAFFEVFSKRWSSQTKINSPMTASLHLTGMMGIVTLVVGVPLLVLLHYTSFELFECPSNEVILTILLLGVFDAFFNFLLLLIIYLTTPLFASLGCMTTLPASILWDSLVHHYELPCLGILGVVLIALGFAGFCCAEYRAGRSLEYHPVTELTYPEESSNIKFQKRESQVNIIVLGAQTEKSIEMVSS